jgi:hypothetical protein
MHRLASTSYGAVMALVGHISIQALQVPQWLVAGLSIGSGDSYKFHPKRTMSHGLY